MANFEKRRRTSCSLSATAATLLVLVLARSCEKNKLLDCEAFQVAAPHHGRERLSSSLFQKTSLWPAATLPFQRGSLLRSSTSWLSSSNDNNSNLNDSSSEYDHACDVLVLGSGPAARAIASLLSASNQLKVILADQNFDRRFAPNYGVWHDEWQTVCEAYQQAGVKLEGGQCGQSIDRKWSVTDCFFGGSFGMPMTQRIRLDRPYYRVDRDALRDSLTDEPPYQVLRANHISKACGVNLYEPARSLLHDATGSTIRLQAKDSLLTVRTQLIVDCTGHETKLVLKEARQAPQSKPGFQIAYGILADVEEPNKKEIDNMIGPYAKDAMTLFDYRTDHYESSDEETQAKVGSAPTFMYAMPLKDNQVFFEETSLVARPAVSFQECKDRCYRRLEHLGITVTKVYEEEFCYIPMGGPLPSKDQRILALGGAAAMVHPSTGYHLCRCLMGAQDMAQVIEQELLSMKTKPAQNDRQALDRIAASAYHALWTPENIRQRNFAVFGGEFLMKQTVVGLRGFFDGFFRLPTEMWAGFLAGWPGLPNNDQHDSWWKRMFYGVTFLTKLPPQVSMDMLLNIIGYSIDQGVPLPQSVTPFLGEPPSYEFKSNTDNMGDVAAKEEAKSMLVASKVEEVVPVAFDEGGTVSTTSPLPNLPSILPEVKEASEASLAA